MTIKYATVKSFQFKDFYNKKSKNKTNNTVCTFLLTHTSINITDQFGCIGRVNCGNCIAGHDAYFSLRSMRNRITGTKQ